LALISKIVHQYLKSNGLRPTVLQPSNPFIAKQAIDPFESF